MIEHQWVFKANAGQNRRGRYSVAVALLACLLTVGTPAFSQQPPAPGDGLPPGFQPPRPAPKELSLENEQITAEDVSGWKKKKLDYQKALASRAVNPDVEKQIAEGIRVNVLQLSLAADRNNLTDLRKAIIRDLDQNAKNLDVRIFANKEVVKRCKELLDGNFHVRCAAVLLMADLDVTAAGIDPIKNPPVAYIEVVDDLLDVLDPPAGGIDQPEGIRILAAEGVRRQFEFGRTRLKPNSKTPNNAAVRLLKELAASRANWYYWVLISAAVQTGQATVQSDNNASEPAIVDALSRMIADATLPHSLRCHAARELGRAAMPGGIQGDPIAWAISKLGADIANGVVAGKVAPVSGFFCLQDLFLCFRGAPGEQTVDARTGAGLLNSLGQPSIKTAYGDFLPIFQTIYKQFQEIPRGATAPAAIAIPGGFISKVENFPQPASMSISNGSKPITVPFQVRNNAGAATPQAVPQAGQPGTGPVNAG